MAQISFQSNLGEVIKASKEQLAAAATIIGGMAESFAKQHITEQGAVDTGHLRNSISHAVEDNGHTVVIGTNVHYAPYIELGTGAYAEGGNGRKTPWSYKDSKGKWHTTIGMKPRPYLRPAIEKHKDEYKEVLQMILSSE